MRLAVLTLAVTLAGSVAAADNAHDVLYFHNNTKRMVFIESETTVELMLRSPANTILKQKLTDVDRWDYAEMLEDGSWPKGLDARDRGLYEEAADRFTELESGGREWMKVYGAYFAGDSLELASKFDGAADEFKKIVDGFPNHRLWLSADYRYGFALARAKKAPEAEKVAAALDQRANQIGDRTAAAYANAIRAALNEGEAGKMTDFAKKALGGINGMRTERGRRGEGFDIWYHFKAWYAEALLHAKSKDALPEYKRLVNELGDDPVRKMQASLGYGMALIDEDKEEALNELLKLDTMPFGSPDQKCRARYYAGKLLWDKAQELKQKLDMKDEAKAAFVKDIERSARMVLSAAANSTSSIDAKGLADTLLNKQLPPDPDKPADKPEGAADGKDAAANPKDAGASSKEAAADTKDAAAHK